MSWRERIGSFLPMVTTVWGIVMMGIGLFNTEVDTALYMAVGWLLLFYDKG